MSGALMTLLGSGAVWAQGVPVFDGPTQVERLQILLQMETDEDTQVEKAEKRSNLKALKSEQLAAIDRVIATMRSNSTFGPGLDAGFGGRTVG